MDNVVVQVTQVGIIRMIYTTFLDKYIADAGKLQGIVLRDSVLTQVYLIRMIYKTSLDKNKTDVDILTTLDTSTAFRVPSS